jgi:2-polyprenylphenol hydroxylase and related flavodoxin oxidoreductases
MFKIISSEIIGTAVAKLVIEAPLIAAAAKAGQFVILRVSNAGERIPLTISDHDAAAGTITIIAQDVGATTHKLCAKKSGEFLPDVVGPLGTPSHFEGVKKAVVIGGGVGCAIALPQARYLKALGAQVDIIAGFRDKDLVILEDEMTLASDNLYITTNDGSYGKAGFVTDQLAELSNDYDLCVCIGPIPMMKGVAEMTRGMGLRTIVSLNPIMVDGTGMCGGCRVTVGGKTKFACVDGPDFDGHEVDFDGLRQRNTVYREFEQHKCKIGLNN